MIEMPYPLHGAGVIMTASIIEVSSLDCIRQAEVVHNPIILKEIPSTNLKIFFTTENIYFIKLSFWLDTSKLYAITLFSTMRPPNTMINVLNFIKIASVSSELEDHFENLFIYD